MLMYMYDFFAYKAYVVCGWVDKRTAKKDKTRHRFKSISSSEVILILIPSPCLTNCGSFRIEYRRMKILQKEMLMKSTWLNWTLFHLVNFWNTCRMKKQIKLI